MKTKVPIPLDSIDTSGSGSCVFIANNVIPSLTLLPEIELAKGQHEARRQNNDYFLVLRSELPIKHVSHDLSNF